jgi:hypothetical protein
LLPLAVGAPTRQRRTSGAVRSIHAVVATSARVPQPLRRRATSINMRSIFTVCPSSPIPSPRLWFVCRSRSGGASETNDDDEDEDDEDDKDKDVSSLSSPTSFASKSSFIVNRMFFSLTHSARRWNRVMPPPRAAAAAVFESCTAPT